MNGASLEYSEKLARPASPSGLSLRWIRLANSFDDILAKAVLGLLLALVYCMYFPARSVCIISRVGVSDVNDKGEVVYELRDLTASFNRIFSTTRGYLTPANTDAIQPSVNNLDEVVYSGRDSEFRQQIFSSVRGQLTFFG